MNPTQNQPAEVSVTPADLLRGAALYLQRHGWTQRAYFDLPADGCGPTPPACAQGAIAIAVYGEALPSPYDVDRRERWDYLRRSVVHDPESDLSASGWNDEPDRTAGQVIAALRAAAHDWDHTHGGAQ